MRFPLKLAMAGLGFVVLTGGCVSHSDLNAYATKSDLAALRSELTSEIQKAQDSAQKAQSEAAAASDSAQKAAASAAASAEKADAIFRQSLRK